MAKERGEVMWKDVVGKVLVLQRGGREEMREGEQRSREKWTVKEGLR